MEKYQTWQTLSQIGIAVFSILAILCGYGSYHFGVEKDRKKQPEVSSKLDSTNKSGNTYHITGDFVHGDKIDNLKTNKIKSPTAKTENTYNSSGDIVHGDKIGNYKKEEINAPNALIVTKDQSGGNNTVNFYQNEFKPLDGEIILKIKTKLTELANKYPKHPMAFIEIESGNSQRNKIALTLEELLIEKKLGVYGKGNTFIGRFPDYPISVFINPTNKKYVNELIQSLELFLKGEYRIIEDENIPSDYMRIYINGQPLFDQNGKVKVQ